MRAQNWSLLLEKNKHLPLDFLLPSLAGGQYFLIDCLSIASLSGFHHYSADLSLRVFPLQKHRDLFENRVRAGPSMDI